jgi:TatD DNase family protein
MYVDSHCHLNFPEFSKEIPTLLARMAEHSVELAMVISVELPTLPDILNLADQYPQLYASVGVHPDYDETEEPTEKQLIEWAKHPKVLAIGETGLDYYRLNGRSIDDMAWQRERFRRHIRAAKEVKKPLIIHTRQAAEDTLKIMREEGAAEVGGVMHCFTETWDIAQAAMKNNFYISFSGIVTFKNAKTLQEIAKNIPLDRILIETDAPYLAPVPHRGKRNEPAYVAYIGKYIAQLRGEDEYYFQTAIRDNFKKLFNV